MGHHNHLLARAVIVFSAAVMVVAAPSSVSSSETQAQVVETPARVMTVQPLATFNHGKPFLAERDPVTGAFDLRTTPVNPDDYLYEEVEELDEDPVDRKDTVATATSNHIISIPAKDSEFHKFLNLPVHYSSSSKFPLISSSYANTKVQGHGTSNHRPATSTPSTIPPSYYPHRTTPQSTTSPPVKNTSYEPPRTTVAIQNLTKTSTTTPATTSTSASSSPPAAYEYEYEYDYGESNDKPPPSNEPPKSDYDFMGFLSTFGLSGSSSTTRAPIERSTISIPTSSPSYENKVANKIPSIERETENERPTTRPTPSSSVMPTTTSSQPPERDIEPKPTKVVDDTSSKTTPTPSSVESTMIAIKNESVLKKNDTLSDNQVKKNEEVKTTEKPSGQTSGTHSGSQSENHFGITNVEEGGWQGKPGQSAEVEPISLNQDQITASIGIAPTLPDSKPEGTYHVKYSAVRPPSFGSQRPPMPQSTKFDQNRPGLDDEAVAAIQVSPTHGHVNFHAPATLHAQIPSTGSKYQSGSSRPTLEIQTHPSNFSNNEAPAQQQKPHGSYPPTYHATMTDKKPIRVPASTYLQGPLIYGGQYQPPKDKEQLSNKKQEDNLVFLKATYRPQPSPHPQYHSNIQQQPNLTQGQMPFQRLPPQQFGSFNQLQQSSPQTQQQQQQHQQLQQQQQLKPQPAGDRDEAKPVTWPPKSPKPHDEPNIPPPISFFPRPERPPSGIGTVEAVRPPPRQPDRGSVAVSSVSGDTQSYSLQTSFSIGVPSGPSEDKPKVTQGTVSTVPLASIQSETPLSDHHQQQQLEHLPVYHSQQTSQLSNYQQKVKPPPLQPPTGLSPQLVQPVSANTIRYPKPSWETNLNKQYKEPIKRNPLPNILPQFRPNAKIGTVDPPGQPQIMGMNYVREPVDRLQPPPLPPPQRPLHRSDEPLQQSFGQHHRQHQQHLQQKPQQLHQQSGTRIFSPVRPVAANLRGDQLPAASTPLYSHMKPPSGSIPVPPQPVHRRNGIGTKVTTLQMIQAPPSDSSNNDEPVMIVYPSNNNGEAATSSQKGNWRDPPDFENDDEFPHDLEESRIKDTPILKGKPPTSKPPLKVEFPYPLIKPTTDADTKERQDHLATSSAHDKAVLSEDSPMSHHIQDYRPSMNSAPSGTAPQSLSPSLSTAAPSRLTPVDGEFGWSVIGARTDEYEQTTTPVASSVSNSGLMVPPKLTGGFRPIPAPVQDR